MADLIVRKRLPLNDTNKAAIAIQTYLSTANMTLTSSYVNARTPITVVCNTCGYFWKGQYSALRDRKILGCNNCLGMVCKNTPIEQIQKELHESGKNFKLIKEIKTVGDDKKYETQCNVCERVWVSTKYRLLCNGCSGCSRKVKGSVSNTQSKLSGRNIVVAGNYKNAHSLLECTCLVCSCVWKAHSHNLINGKRGCPSCALTGYDPLKAGSLYYLKITHNNEVFWKIGITNLTVEKRFKPEELKKIEVVFCKTFSDGSIPRVLEKMILKKYKQFRVLDKFPLRSGNTELFSKDVLHTNLTSEVDLLWQI